MLISEEQLKTLLLRTGIIDENGFSKIQVIANSTSESLIDTLIDQDIVSDEHLGMIIADFLHQPFIVLSKISISEDVLRVIPERLARKYKIIPFSRDSSGLKVAMADPANQELLEMLFKKTNIQVVSFLATERDIYNTLRFYRKNLQEAFDELIKKSNWGTAGETPIAYIVDLIIQTAQEEKASDVHIEPQEKDCLIRFRIDGVLHDVLKLPKALHEQIITRIKVLSRLRTDEHLAPQDGKFRLLEAEEEIDIRVSILPIADGEKVALRLLASKFRQFSLIDLGMRKNDLEKVTRGIHKSYGMVLSTGPTGSGKTTTIYAILKILNSREKNITTIEDPVEYRMRGVNQIQTNPKTNLTFASGLRSILRQDPNIIFVGEIRDNETASIAVNAALTGHLVLSTLHTNDAATTLPRLIDMDVEPFLVASTVNIIIGQRLVRKICEMCKVSQTFSSQEVEKKIPKSLYDKYFSASSEIVLYNGKGCKVCHGSGYMGRIGVFEVLEITKKIRQLIITRADSDQISKTASEEGMTTMFEDGLEKIIFGQTTLEEVLRVTKVE